MACSSGLEIKLLKSQMNRSLKLARPFNSTRTRTSTKNHQRLKSKFQINLRSFRSIIRVPASHTIKNITSHPKRNKRSNSRHLTLDSHLRRSKRHSSRLLTLGCHHQLSQPLPLQHQSLSSNLLHRHLCKRSTLTLSQREVTLISTCVQRHQKQRTSLPRPSSQCSPSQSCPRCQCSLCSR